MGIVQLFKAYYSVKSIRDRLTPRGYFKKSQDTKSNISNAKPINALSIGISLIKTIQIASVFTGSATDKTGGPVQRAFQKLELANTRADNKGMNCQYKKVASLCHTLAEKVCSKVKDQDHCQAQFSEASPGPSNKNQQD